MDIHAEFVARAKQGDREAYGKIYEIYLPRVFRFVYYLTGKKEQSEDICQEAFLKGWKALASFNQSKGTIQAFLFKIARNLVIDWHRKKKESLLSPGFDVASGEELDKEIEIKEREEKVKKLLETLEKEERQILILRFFEELTTAEVAKVMNMKEGALRVRVHRIMAKLRLELEV